MKNGLSIGLAVALSIASTQSPALPSTDTRAVPTYESVGLYWTNPGAAAATGCEVKYRRVGNPAWTPGLAMWFDARNAECRGSLVHLAPDTAYEVEFNLPSATPARALGFRTWSNVLPVARTVVVNSSSGTLNVNEGGSLTGYVVYQGAPGAVLDALNAVPFNVFVNASYVIVRGLTLRGAQQDAIRISPTVSDVVIEDNEITDWGRPRGGGYGMDLDSAVRAVCSTPTLQRVTIQRNEIHDPRYSANSWSIAHPQGPQGITFSYCGGNHVIRHNEIFSTTGRYFNDIIGGEDNYSTTGFPNADSDIYGNELSHAWDDAIEAEGANRNVRIWGNYIDRTAIGIATTPTATGPVYLFRNVYNRSRYYSHVPPDQDSRQPLFKAGSDLTLGDGRRYVFHNTMLQATEPGSLYGLGGSHGLSGTGPARLLNNTVSKNNVYHGWRSWQAYFEPGVGNDFANDMYNGSAGAVVVNGINATPVYAPGHGWVSEAMGLYQLSAGSRGFDEGVRVANFNDSHHGAAPDLGAHETGSAPMRFGIAASAGPSVGTPSPGARAGTDVNADGKSDLLWRNTSTGQVFRMLMNGFAIVSGAVAHDEPNLAWSVVGDADFNGDGTSDLLWRNSSTGQVFLMPFHTGGLPVGGAVVAIEANPAWRIVHTPDLDGDGNADILWWNASTGQVYAMLMDGTLVTRQGFVYTEPNTAWRIVATGDNGSGKRNQLFWRNAATGQVFLMTVTVDGSTFAQSGQMIYQEPNTSWKVLGAADFNADGKSDLVWRNESTGQVYLMLMSGSAIAGGAEVYRESNLAWKLVAFGDYNGDGRADLLWRNDSTGQVYTIVMNGLAVVGAAMIYQEPNTSWELLGPWEYGQSSGSL